MPFQPGNQLGAANKGHHRPRTSMCTQALISLLNEPAGDTDKAKVYRLCERLYENALAGDSLAIKEIFDRVDGKAPQSVHVANEPLSTNYTLILHGMTPEQAAEAYGETLKEIG